MRFYIRKRRQPPGIIIVALIDVLIVLLIFLMVTTTFNQQPSVKVSLPESSNAKKSGVSEAPPLVIIIEANGGFRLGPEAKPVTPDQLKTGLKTAVARNPEIKVAISADKTAPFGQFVRVVDIVKEAGLQEKAVSVYEAGRETLVAMIGLARRRADAPYCQRSRQSK